MKINIQPIEKLVHNRGFELEVHSIFFTIQGEGPLCGMPAVFIRLAGCNLQCPACDTSYTDGRVTRDIRDITAKVRDLTYHLEYRPLVVITGGEPFRQNISKLVDKLIEAGHTVQIETNGTLPPPDGLSKEAVIVCSPKSGKVNINTAARAMCFKYVMAFDSVDPDDGLPILALDHSAAPRVARPPAGFKGTVYLQPMDSQDEEVNRRNLRACVSSCMEHGHVLQLQVHKIIGME
jgi:7-carboxy-7-deazaguanine synthase